MKESTKFMEKSIGGHIALDLLNTVSIANDKIIDALQSDDDVLNWLNDFDANRNNNSKDLPKLGLLNSTRKLRDEIRALLTARKEGKSIDLTVINQYLAYDISHPVLIKESGDSLILERQRSIKRPEQLLSPIVNAAAELLANENLDLVRRCESPDCVLWFYDRTKGHKRRWCSMAICGNRHKVASFRQKDRASK